MNNKRILWIIGMIIISPMLLIILFLSLRMWPLWLLVIIIIGVIFYFKENKLPKGNDTIGKIKAELINLLHQLNFYINSAAFKNITRKLFLYPMLAIVLVAGIAFIIEFAGKDYFKSRSTQKEMIEITEALNKYKYHLNSYPENLGVLIGNNPLRKEWMEDEWGNTYKYNVSADGQNFQLISFGRDWKEGGGDDISLNKKEERNKN